ncbi:energy transducer TonB [Sphingobium sufflavum]|uniref:energy transducer TonB n=1 Tax=Sphingobium sufflavum TaxID=1129547 RepID=UPI001F4070FA|nr:energy transducer TonB [Sphingobium sufflavum]MCE7797025.1 energy transducer TonB [Sphingobium sufflavum]
MFKLASGILSATAAAMILATPVMAQSTDWSKQVARMIAAKQTYPRMAQERGEQGTARVKVYVSATGNVDRTELIATSGSAPLDREAMILPTRVGTLPAPTGGATTIVLPFTWKLL